MVLDGGNGLPDLTDLTPVRPTFLLTKGQTAAPPIKAAARGGAPARLRRAVSHRATAPIPKGSPTRVARLGRALA